VEVTPVGLARFARAAASAPGRRTGGPPAAEASPTLAVLDLGRSGTTVAFCRDGALAQFRTLPGRAGLSPEGDQVLLAELKRAVHFYELDERSDVAELLVCGARAAEADALVDRLGDELDVRPMALESAGLLRRTAGAADAAAVLPAFASAIGAALRPPDEQFNFRQAEFLSPGERSRARTRSVGMAAAVAALVVLGGANLFAHYYLKEQAYTALRDDQRRLFTETFSDVRVVVDELEQARGAMLALSRRAAFLGEGELGALVALERLTRTLEALPELKVDRLQIAGNDVRFEGEVGSFEAVDRVKELLRQLESASQVTISDARLGVDQQRVRFKASLLFGSATAGAGEGTPGRGERIG
jgi:Tfp pilus assembly protein PilN